MISFIVPVLNEADNIAVVLEHVATLSGVDEVIVVDGGSSDCTTAIASRYARVVSGPRGRARQMNLGAGIASGDTLLFLHADTRLPHGAVSEIEEALSDPLVVGGRFRVRLDNPGLIYRLIGSMINLRDRLFGGFTGDQAIFVRAGVFQALGGYRDVSLMEDLDFGRRMGHAGRVVRLPVSVITSARRWERDGVAKTIVQMWVLRLLFALGCHPSRLKTFYGDTR